MSNFGQKIDNSDGSQISPSLIVRNLPSFAENESDLLLDWNVYGIALPGTLERLNELSKATFGIVEADTNFVFPKNFNGLPIIEREALRRDFEKNQSLYETAKVTDESAIVILLRLGFDFRDERGFPLRLTSYFKRQAEAAAKGIMGVIPNLETIGHRNWEINIAKDAKKFMENRK